MQSQIRENEIEAAEGRPDEQPRPYLVPKEAQGADNTLTRRVGAVLDFQFSNGSMPA